MKQNRNNIRVKENWILLAQCIEPRTKSWLSKLIAYATKWNFNYGAIKTPHIKAKAFGIFTNSKDC